MGQSSFFSRANGLRRKAIASGFVATFSVGAVGSSYAGAMNWNQIIMPVMDSGMDGNLKKESQISRDVLVQEFKKWVKESAKQFYVRMPKFKGDFVRVLIEGLRFDDSLYVAKVYNKCGAWDKACYKFVDGVLRNLSLNGLLDAFVKDFLRRDDLKNIFSLDEMKEKFNSCFTVDYDSLWNGDAPQSSRAFDKALGNKNSFEYFLKEEFKNLKGDEYDSGVVVAAENFRKLKEHVSRKILTSDVMIMLFLVFFFLLPTVCCIADLLRPDEKQQNKKNIKPGPRVEDADFQTNLQKLGQKSSEVEQVSSEGNKVKAFAAK